VKLWETVLLSLLTVVAASAVLFGPFEERCVITSRDTVASYNGGCEDPSVPVEQEDGTFRPGPLFPAN